MAHRPEDLGAAAVADVRAWMQVDDEWSMPITGGFAWWGASLRQRVWSNRIDVAHDRAPAWRVEVETDVLRNVASSTDRVDALLADLNAGVASGYAWIHDPSSRTVRAATSAYVYEDMAPMISRLVAWGAAASAGNAHHLAEWLGEELKGEADRTAHPRNGWRQGVDDMLNVARSAPELSDVVDCVAASEFEKAVQVVNDDLGGWANGVARGLSAEFVFGSDATSLVILDSRSPHDILGHGVRAWLLLPERLPAQAATQLASQLNRRELAGESLVHCFGAWAPWSNDLGLPSWMPPAFSFGDSAKPSLAYCAFLPNLLCTPGLATNLAIWLGARSSWAASVLRPGEPPGDLDSILLARLDAVRRETGDQGAPSR